MLNLNDLGNGLPAITPVFGMYLAQAGAVCFEEQGHANGVALSVQGSYSNNYSVQWPEVTTQMLKCLNDPEVATEHGAMGVAILLVKKLVGYSVIERSRKGTGFDYWLGSDAEEHFQNKARLEVSGIRSGHKNAIGARVKTKMAQVTPTDKTGLPAYIVVVEFGQPVADVRTKNEQSQ